MVNDKLNTLLDVISNLVNIKVPDNIKSDITLPQYIFDEMFSTQQDTILFSMGSIMAGGNMDKTSQFYIELNEIHGQYHLSFYMKYTLEEIPLNQKTHDMIATYYTKIKRTSNLNSLLTT